MALTWQVGRSLDLEIDVLGGLEIDILGKLDISIGIHRKQMVRSAICSCQHVPSTRILCLLTRCALSQKPNLSTTQEA